jgi:inosine-uridine nucleoside N-ribohydrolase
LSQKLVIDADPGIVDALAILAALAEPTLDVIGLTAVPGVVSGQQATRNLQYLVNAADPLRHPRVGQSEGSDCPVSHTPPQAPRFDLLNGRFGLGDVDPQVPELHHRREAARLIVELVREHPQNVRIVTLGPLTNIAMALELEPQLPTLLGGLLVCGGAMAAGGDVTATAEFNFWQDPAAARTVLRSPVGKLIVPLDISDRATLTFEEVERLTGLIPSTRIGELVGGLLHFFARTSRQLLPREIVSFPAAIAVAIAAREANFTTDPLIVDVETAGALTCGMMVVDRRAFATPAHTADVVVDADLPAVIDFLCRNLRRIGMAAEG